MEQMCLNLNQRWTNGHASYRRPEEPICTYEYDVEEITSDCLARDFVLRHHYSGTYPAARFRIGLYHHGRLVGVAVYSHPCSDKVLTNVFHGIKATDAVELGRFVLLDEVPANGETFFLARSFGILHRRHEIAGVVSFSDPMPRRNLAGELVFRGHYGGIYQAHNAIYVGRSCARTLRLLPDGQTFSDRAAQKIRAGESGWRYASSQLEHWGATPVPEDPYERRLWLESSLNSVTTTVRHRGNHKYAWPLSREIRASLPVSLPYPKQTDTPPLQ